MKNISIARTVSFGDDEKITYCGSVSEGETDFECLERIESRLHFFFKKKDESVDLFHNVSKLKTYKVSLEKEIEGLEKHIRELEELKEKLCKWLEENNIDFIKK